MLNICPPTDGPLYLPRVLGWQSILPTHNLAHRGNSTKATYNNLLITKAVDYSKQSLNFCACENFWKFSKSFWQLPVHMQTNLNLLIGNLQRPGTYQLMQKKHSEIWPSTTVDWHAILDCGSFRLGFVWVDKQDVWGTGKKWMHCVTSLLMKVVKGTVSQKLRPMLLYIIQKHCLPTFKKYVY